MTDLLEAKVQLSGSEEALTDFAATKQRMVSAVEQMADKNDAVAQQQVDKILQEAVMGPMQNMRQFSRQYVQELRDLTKGFKTVQEQLSREKKKQEDATREKNKSAASKLFGELGKVRDKMGPGVGRLIGDASKAVTGVLGSLGAALPMGVGGIIGLMLYGVAKTQELEAQANRFKQIFEESMAGVGRYGEQASRRAVNELSERAKELELRFAATRADMEAINRVFATSGITAAETTEKLTKSIGAEQRDLWGLTLSLEKHFELAGGTVAKQAADMMSQYGMSVDETADTILKLNIAGAESGIGLQNFVNSVSQGAAAVKHMGVNIQDVAGLTQQLGKLYEGMGLDKHFAGQTAATGVSAMLSGIASLSMGHKTLLAEDIFPDKKGPEALQALEENLARKGGATPDMLEKITRSEYNRAMEQANGDPSKARMWLTTQGFSTEGSMTMMKVGELLKQGVSFEVAAKGHMEQIRDSLKTEEEKTGEFKRSMEEMLRGMSDIGSALFNTVTAGLAELILSVKFWAAMLKGDQMEAGLYAKAMQDTADVFPQALKQAATGLKHMGAAASEINIPGLNVLGEAFQSVNTPSVPQAPGGLVTPAMRRAALGGQSTNLGIGNGGQQKGVDLGAHDFGGQSGSASHAGGTVQVEVRVPMVEAVQNATRQHAAHSGRAPHR